MSRWLLVVILLIGAHFSASALVPLDAQAQRTFGGLLRWVWPWSFGDRGALGAVAQPSGLPGPGLLLALAGAGAFVLALLAVMGWWIPSGWWRALAGAGAILQLALLAVFLGPTKLLPLAYDIFLLYFLWARGAAPAAAP